jgi:hypothetical protein
MPTQSLIQTPFEAPGLTSHAAAGQGNTILIFGDHLVTEGRREGLPRFTQRSLALLDLLQSRSTAPT